MCVLLMGDLLQLPPTFGTPLYKGTNPVFSSFERHLLTTQHRSKSLPHTSNIALSRDMEAQNPLRSVDWSIYSYLSPDDMSGEFADATHIVSTNMERGELNRILGERFAERNNQRLFRWRFQLPPWMAKNEASMEHLWDVLDNREDLHGLFTRGARAYLSKNLCTKKKMCNGSLCHMDSFGYFTAQKRRDFNACVAAAHDSCVINIPPPDYIIVRVNGVIQNSTCDFRLRGFKRVIKATTHPVSIGFACTFWKVQGLTLPKTVLHMGSPHMSLAAVHVGMTRVELPENMRLFPIDDWRPLFRMSWDDELRHLMIDLQATNQSKKEIKEVKV